MVWWRLMAAGLCTFGLASPVTAFEASLEDGGWELIGVPGQAETTFQLMGDGVLKVVSDHSVAFLYKRVEDAGPRLQWRWLVDDMGLPSDLARVGEDDRPIAIHLWFPEEEGQGSLFGGLAELFGFPRVGNALTYVWGGSEHAPRISPNPHLPEGQGVIIVLRNQSEQMPKWVHETVEYQADYFSAFGKPAPTPTYVAISGDSDDLGGVRRASIADLSFIQ